MFCKINIYYTIQPNDTLWTIAQKYQTTIQAIQKMNQKVDLDNLRVGQVIRICPYTSEFYSNKALSINNQIRLLWEQHVTWTKITITSIVFELPNQDEVISRFLRNADDFTHTFRPYYGEDYANRFGTLFKEHIAIGIKLMKTSKDQNEDLTSTLEMRWYQNALNMAQLLSQINPYWILEHWKDLFFTHLRFVKQELQTMNQGQYEESIDTFDQIELQALEMADTMASGIIKQFQIY